MTRRSCISQELEGREPLLGEALHIAPRRAPRFVVPDTSIGYAPDIAENLLERSTDGWGRSRSVRRQGPGSLHLEGASDAMDGTISATSTGPWSHLSGRDSRAPMRPPRRKSEGGSRCCGGPLPADERAAADVRGGALQAGPFYQGQPALAASAPRWCRSGPAASGPARSGSRRSRSRGRSRRTYLGSRASGSGLPPPGSARWSRPREKRPGP